MRKEAMGNCKKARENQEEEMSKREQAMKKREEAVEARKKALENEEEAMSKQKEAMKKREEAVEARKKALENEEEAMSKQKEAMKKLEEAMDSRKKALESQEEAMRQREEALKKREEALEKLRESMKQARSAMKRVRPPLSGPSKHPRSQEGEGEEEEEEEERVARITDLPEEVLTIILRRLSPEHLAASAAPVCRLWTQLAVREVLGQELVFRGNVVSTSQVIAFLKMAPQLECLELAERNDFSQILQFVVEKKLSLKKLTIKGYRSTPKNQRLPMDLLRSLILNSEGIQNLIIEWVILDEDIDFSDVAPALCEIRKVTFRGFELADVSLAELINSCPLVEEIRLSPKFFLRFNMAGAEFSTMTKPAPYGGLHQLPNASVSALVSCKQLKALELACDLAEIQLQRLVDLKNLTSLKLSGVYSIPPLAWQNYFVYNTRVRKLTVLGLPCCSGVDDRVLSVIAQSCPCLKDADFSYCFKITQVGVGDLIRGCGSLVVLKLWCTDPRVASTFTLIPQCLPGLRILSYLPDDYKVFGTRNWDTELQSMSTLKTYNMYMYED